LPRAHENIFSGPTLDTHWDWERMITFAPLGSRLLLTSSVIPFRNRMPCAAWATTSFTAWEAAWYVLSTVYPTPARSDRASSTWLKTSDRIHERVLSMREMVPNWRK
jgi:hypothetical protein